MDRPIVNTLNGRVRGKIFKTYYGHEAFEFHKIPYMKPPVGNLRFKDPEPVDNWSGVIDGLQEVKSFSQFNPMLNSYDGKETELYINVFTKSLQISKLQPVVVNIHDGAFVCGSSSSDFAGPDNFLRNDIVFCSFNYRLSVLGFLSLDDPNLKVPGNAGLKDQTLALKWIKDNVTEFGGNPNNITLIGMCAGSASVNYHMISDVSRDLFHKAILMSGAVLNSRASVPDHKFALRLAQKFGWQDRDTQAKALQILQSVPVEELVMQQNSILTDEEKKMRIYEPFVPSIEPYVSNQCFLPEPLVQMIPKQWSRKIPILIGATTNESNLIWGFFEKLGELPKAFDYIGDFKYLIPSSLCLDRNSTECADLSRQIKCFYYGSDSINLNDEESLTKYFKLMSDKLFLHGIFATIKARVVDADNAAPTYFYRFNYNSDTFNFSRVFLPPNNHTKGVGHGDEINYIFKTVMYEKLGKNSLDYLKVQQMSGMWNKFIVSGNPNCIEIEPTIWTPVTDSNKPFKCLDISDELKMIDYPETDRMIFWDKIFQIVLKY